MLKSHNCFSTFLIFLFLNILFACKSNSEKKDVKWTKEQSVNWNKNMAIEEDIDIKIFLSKKKDWKMTKSGTGLQYYIYFKGNGPKAQEGLQAKIRYKIQLLDGTLCYQSEKDELFTFKIDKSEIESGVQEGVKYMNVGDKAKLIIPSHIAHGLVGDLDKIPPLSPIVVDLELVQLNP